MSTESHDIRELLGKLETWESLYNANGVVDVDESESFEIPISEAFLSPDAGKLFPKVISRSLKEAAEPQMLVTPLLSVVRLNKGRSMEFPAVNAIQAHEIPEGQEYPEQSLVFADQVEGKVSKKGVKVAFSDEVIADSLWDIVGLHVRAAGRAMARLKEQIALQRFGAAAVVVFDNSSSPTTTGTDINGVANNTLSWDDVLDMAGTLIAENHVPTDFILHPLMWSVFLRESVFHTGGPLAAQAWGFQVNSADSAANASSPLGLNVLLSPFVNFTAAVGSTPAKSDVFLIDRNDVGVLLVKEDMSTEDVDDRTRDLRALKLRERYDIVMLGDGEGITVAKDVSLARNYEIQVTNETP